MCFWKVPDNMLYEAVGYMWATVKKKWESCGASMSCSCMASWSTEPAVVQEIGLRLTGVFSVWCFKDWKCCLAIRRHCGWNIFSEPHHQHRYLHTHQTITDKQIDVQQRGLSVLGWTFCRWLDIIREMAAGREPTGCVNGLRFWTTLQQNTESLPVHPLVGKPTKNCKNNNNNFLLVCFLMGMWSSNNHENPYLKKQFKPSESCFICLVDTLICHFNTDSFTHLALPDGFVFTAECLLEQLK